MTGEQQQIEIERIKSFLESEFGYSGHTQGSTHRNLAALSDEISRHNETLYGNGHPGLVTRVTVLENTNQTSGSMLHVAITVVGILVGAAAAIIAALL